MVANKAHGAWLSEAAGAESPGSKSSRLLESTPLPAAHSLQRPAAGPLSRLPVWRMLRLSWGSCQSGHGQRTGHFTDSGAIRLSGENHTSMDSKAVAARKKLTQKDSIFFFWLNYFSFFSFIYLKGGTLSPMSFYFFFLFSPFLFALHCSLFFFFHFLVYSNLL